MHEVGLWMCSGLHTSLDQAVRHSVFLEKCCHEDAHRAPTYNHSRIVLAEAYLATT